MEKEPLSEAIYRKSVNNARPTWGRALMTDIEVKFLFQLRNQLESWESVRRLLLSGAVPTPSGVNADGFIQAVIADGCPVGFDVYHDPARETDESVWSYLTRNRAFRAYARAFRNNPGLLSAWRGVEDKKPGQTGIRRLIRPDGLPENQLTGIEKLGCFWACNLLRGLEAVRTGRETLFHPIYQEPIPLSSDETDCFTIPWTEVTGSVTDAKSVNEIAVLAAERTFRLLTHKGLTVEKALAFIFRYYSPHGVLMEHGQLSNILDIWTPLAQRLDSLDITVHVNQIFRSVLIDAVGQYNESAAPPNRLILFPKSQPLPHSR